MTNIRDRAAAEYSAGRQQPAPEQAAGEGPATAPLEPIEYTGEITDAPEVSVHTAWARVMADVQSISKTDQYNAAGTRYNFRGIDRVVNAVGPALRRHGVLVLPTRILSTEYRDTRTSKGNAMQECVVTVQWTVIGPAGDQLPPMESAGQGTDTMDKATAKAMSVAQRVLFLTALQIPTQDPDIDRGHERGERPTPRAADYVDEIAHPRTSASRLRQIHKELRTHGLLDVAVTNEVGDEEPVGKMVARIGADRASAESPGGEQ